MDTTSKPTLSIIIPIGTVSKTTIPAHKESEEKAPVIIIDPEIETVS